jgi:Transposase, Mutator family
MSWEEVSRSRHPCPCGRGEYEESYWSDDWGRGETRYEMLCPECKGRYVYVDYPLKGFYGPPRGWTLKSILEAERRHREEVTAKAKAAYWDIWRAKFAGLKTKKEAWEVLTRHGRYYPAYGIHFSIRLEDDRQCILVLMGATPEGTEEVIAISEGHRESEQSWLALLLDCQSRGLALEPELAIADGALGFWKALPKVWPKTRQQRCWVHKTANVLDKIPKGQQPKAKVMLHAIWMAASWAEANQAFDLFQSTWEAKYPKATACLLKDREALLAFSDFPAEHWLHIRTTNPIESVVATVRLRTCKTKGCGSRVACETMVFKLMQSAAKGWRKLNGSLLLPEVLRGVKFAPAGVGCRVLDAACRLGAATPPWPGRW